MFKKAKKFLAVQILAALEPGKLAAISEERALKAFRRAAALVPAYRQLLKDKNINPDEIRSISDFKERVPIIDKNETFKLFAFDIKKLCVKGEPRDIKSIIPSSGHTGCFAFSLCTSLENKKSQEGVDFMLDYIFEVAHKKTLLINALPMGIKITSDLVTVVDTSVRSDVVIGIVKTFAACFNQIILVGDNAFVKKILEEGAQNGINWKQIRMNLILGEELLSENLRSYLGEILEIDMDDPKEECLIGSSFGVAEFGLNVFYETRELIMLRRLLQRDAKFKQALIGKDLDNLPGLFYYNPTRVFIEETPTTDGLSQIVLSNLETDTNIPLIRYNIKDEGVAISHNHLKHCLEAFNYQSYMPRIRLPIVAVWGRDKIKTEEGVTVRAEFIKDLLYENAEVANFITGNFRLSNSKAGLKIEIQAKKTGSLDLPMEEKIKSLLTTAIPARTEIILYPYREFPYGMEVDYERKFQYI